MNEFGKDVAAGFAIPGLRERLIAVARRHQAWRYRPYRFWRMATKGLRLKALPRGRRWGSLLSTRAHVEMMRGALNYEYRGMKAVRYPVDVPIYLMLLQQLRPRTVIEIGSKEGGGAVMLGDFMNMLDINGLVWSIDLNRPDPKYQPWNVKFVKGDENQLGEAPLSWDKMSHPWLVIQDASHQYAGVMNSLSFLNKYMVKGDYMVVEDGYITQVGMDGHDRHGGPARAIAEFLHYCPDWRVDTRLCDFFGFNVTANTNGYLVKC